MRQKSATQFGGVLRLSRLRFGWAMLVDLGLGSIRILTALNRSGGQERYGNLDHIYSIDDSDGKYM